METYTGRNGVVVGDNGTCWRAFGSKNVTSPQEYDYQDRNGRPTGVRYGMGFDKTAGGTKIAWVDYPKDMYALEEVTNDDDTVRILTRCNVCSAMDQAASRSGSLPYEKSLPSPVASIDSSPLPQSPHRSSGRVSLGDVASASLPKYLTVGINIGKAFGLRPAGDAVVSLGLSILADLASGFTADPRYKDALQKFSDDMVDGLTPEMVERIKEDAVNIAEAAYQDGEAVLSSKFIKRSMFKTRKDLRDDLERSKLSNASHVSPNQSQSVASLQFNPVGPDRLQFPRLFE